MKKLLDSKTIKYEVVTLEDGSVEAVYSKNDIKCFTSSISVLSSLLDKSLTIQDAIKQPELFRSL